MSEEILMEAFKIIEDLGGANAETVIDFLEKIHRGLEDKGIKVPLAVLGDHHIMTYVTEFMKLKNLKFFKDGK